MLYIFGIAIHKKIIYSIITLVAGYLLYKVLLTVIDKSLAFRMKKNGIVSREQKTAFAIIKNILKYTFFIIACLSILGILGVNAGAILASVGVVGLAIGFAVQDTLKDILSGIFILLENQYAVGDVVMISNFKGEVVSLGLKTTKLRSESGEIKILSNRNIVDITNYSLHHTNLFIDFELDYDNDVEKVERILKQLATNLSAKVKNIKGGFQYVGIQNLGGKVTYRLRTEADVKYQNAIKSTVWFEAKKTFEENEIR